MAKELKTFVLNMKSLDQQIPSPILVGAGDANGRTFRIIFTQEAADMFTPLTKVYLKWFHQKKQIKGYNVFLKKDEAEKLKSPQVWEIKFPRSMLYEGDVICTVEIVDEYSIATTSSFVVHVTSDPYDSFQFNAVDDFSVFQQAAIHLTALANEVEDWISNTTTRFAEMEKDFYFLKDESQTIFEKAKEVVLNIDEKIKKKLDVDKVGIDFNEETPTIKSYIDRQVVTPHLEMLDFTQASPSIKNCIENQIVTPVFLLTEFFGGDI